MGNSLYKQENDTDTDTDTEIDLTNSVFVNKNGSIKITNDYKQNRPLSTIPEEKSRSSSTNSDCGEVVSRSVNTDNDILTILPPQNKLEYEKKIEELTNKLDNCEDELNDLYIKYNRKVIKDNADKIKKD